LFSSTLYLLFWLSASAAGLIGVNAPGPAPDTV